MDCCSAREKLSAYIDGELDELTMEHVEAHLSACSDCESEMVALRSLIAVTGEIDELEPPRALKQAILDVTMQDREANHHSEEMELLLSAFADGELSAPELRDITNHLANCELCRAHLNDLRVIASTAREIDPVEPSPVLRSEIYAAISTPTVKPDSFSLRGWLRRIATPGASKWAAGAAATGVIVLGVVVGTPNGSEQVERSAVEHSKPHPIASRLESGNRRTDTSEATTKYSKAPVKVAVKNTSGKVRHTNAHRPSRSVVAVVTESKPHLKHRATAEPTRLKAEAIEEKTVSHVSAQSQPEPVDVAVVAAPDITEDQPAAVEIKQPAPVDVAEVTAQEQENIKRWLQEAKARSSARKADRSGGITIISKSF